MPKVNGRHELLRAFSSVGRASPLQGEGQKFESSNAHHKKPNDICYSVFYFVVLMTWASNCVSNLRSSADLRTDDARSASPDSEQIEPAGAKPLRRNSVSVEQIQEKSSNAHHKKDNDICYCPFYFECFDSEKLLLKFERGASKVRRTFAKRTTFFEAKSVDTFNASDSRQSSNAHHYIQRPISKSVFVFVFTKFSASKTLDKLYFKKLTNLIIFNQIIL